MSGPRGRKATGRRRYSSGINLIETRQRLTLRVLTLIVALILGCAFIASLDEPFSRS